MRGSHNQTKMSILKDLKISIKYKPSTKGRDSFIMIETSRPKQHLSVEVVIRKIGELDGFVQWINQNYGNHIIPTLKNMDFNDPKYKINKLMNQIEEFLNDIKSNKHCANDEKFHNFIFDQTVNFPQKRGYERMLKKAKKFSRAHINNVFLRKTSVEIQNSNLYLNVYRTLLGCVQNYKKIKEGALWKISQLKNYVQLIQIFAQLESTPCSAILPQELQCQKIQRSIKICDKLIAQAEQAHTRWEILGETIREVQGYLYKGLHEYQNQYEQLNTKLKSYNNCLIQQFRQLIQYIENKMQIISTNAIQLMFSAMEESLMHNLMTNDTNEDDIHVIQIEKLQQPEQYQSPKSEKQ